MSYRFRFAHSTLADSPVYTPLEVGKVAIGWVRWESWIFCPSMDSRKQKKVVLHIYSSTAFIRFLQKILFYA